MRLFELALVAIVRNTKQLTFEALVSVPESIAILLFEALYETGTLTPRLVETFLALGHEDLRSLVVARKISLVNGKPWTPPLNLQDDGYKKRQH